MLQLIIYSRVTSIKILPHLWKYYLLLHLFLVCVEIADRYFLLTFMLEVFFISDSTVVRTRDAYLGKEATSKTNTSIGDPVWAAFIPNAVEIMSWADNVHPPSMPSFNEGLEEEEETSEDRTWKKREKRIIVRAANFAPTQRLSAVSTSQKSIFHLCRHDERSRDCQSCCCRCYCTIVDVDLFDTFFWHSYFCKILKLNMSREENSNKKVAFEYVLSLW